MPTRARAPVILTTIATIAGSACLTAAAFQPSDASHTGAILLVTGWCIIFAGLAALFLGLYYRAPWTGTTPDH